MPRYYFHIRSSEGLIRDPDGTELPDLATAVSEAELAARDLLAELLRRGGVVDGQVFEITTADGHVLERLPFRDVLRLR
jgi:hypothetical protein